MCSDRGLFNNKGSYGIIATRSKEIVFECYNRIPNVYNILSSHRCEAFGILSGLAIFYQLCLYNNINQQNNHTQITILCDNYAVITSINKLKFSNPTLKYYYSPDADISMSIIDVYHTLLLRKSQLPSNTLKAIRTDKTKT
jgi:hypothetical protein